jgi:hypothetical protein
MKIDPPSGSSDLPECHEGRQAPRNFDAMMGKLLSVPHSEIVRREQEYRKQVEANPNRRGPKRKRK